MKTELSSIASQYAEATLELAVSQGGGSEESVLKDLTLINKMLSLDPQLTKVLRHPCVPATEKKAMLVEMFQRHVCDLSMRLLQLLADKRRLNLLPALEIEYRRALNQKKNLVDALLVTAEPVREGVIQEVTKQLVSRLGRQVKLSSSVDATLIAGAVLRIGDQVVDGSLKGKLKALERSLLSV